MSFAYWNTKAPTNSESQQYGWQISEVLSAPANGNSYITPNGCDIIGFTLEIAAASSAKMQITFSSVEDIQANSAVWVDHPSGVVAVSLTDTIDSSVSAIRQVNVSGTSTLHGSIN